MHCLPVRCPPLLTPWQQTNHRRWPRAHRSISRVQRLVPATRMVSIIMIKPPASAARRSRTFQIYPNLGRPLLSPFGGQTRPGLKPINSCLKFDRRWYTGVPICSTSRSVLQGSVWPRIDISFRIGNSAWVYFNVSSDGSTHSCPSAHQTPSHIANGAPTSKGGWIYG